MQKSKLMSLNNVSEDTELKWQIWDSSLGLRDSKSSIFNHYVVMPPYESPH